MVKNLINFDILFLKKNNLIFKINMTTYLLITILQLIINLRFKDFKFYLLGIIDFIKFKEDYRKKIDLYKIKFIDKKSLL